MQKIQTIGIHLTTLPKKLQEIRAKRKGIELFFCNCRFFWFSVTICTFPWNLDNPVPT
jgi:hypothetical protein